MRVEKPSEPLTAESLPLRKQKLERSTQEFESFFLQSVWKAMRRTVPDGSSHRSESKLYTEMLDEAFADNMSRTNRFGLGAMLFKTLERSLEAQAPADGKTAGKETGE